MRRQNPVDRRIRTNYYTAHDNNANNPGLRTPMTIGLSVSFCSFCNWFETPIRTTPSLICHMRDAVVVFI